MKKLATLSAIALASFAVTACNKADPAAEYKQFQAWQQTQEKVRSEAQAEFQQQLVQFSAQQNSDIKNLEPVLQDFARKIEETGKSLDALNVKSNEIKGLKEKAKTVLTLSTELLTDQAKLLITPNEEAQKALQAKTTKLMEEANALQQLQAELDTKFGK